MTAVSLILMILSLGGIWGSLIYYIIRLLKVQGKTEN